MWGMLWWTKELLSTRAEHPIQRGRWEETEGWAGRKKKANTCWCNAWRNKISVETKSIINIQHFNYQTDSFGVYAGQTHRATLIRANQTSWHSGVLTSDSASLMSRLSMLFHESLTASEILFVEFPLFLLFPVISWSVADDEASLSSSLYPSHVTFCE